MKKEIFTIGHSSHTIHHFSRLLRNHGITAVVDVRSHPTSRFHPQFNREVLAADLKKAKIAYVFLGRELGARREERGCYVNGQAKYGLIAKLQSFEEGLHRIREGARAYRIALMCAERDPTECHRAILVCRHLREEGITIQHILGDGNLEAHSDLEKRLVDLFKVRPDLFEGGQDFEQLVERAYDLQGEEIAYEKR
jgi:uncharacterized protein (DUF488 family)